MLLRPYYIILILPLLLGCAVKPISRKEPVPAPVPPVPASPAPVSPGTSIKRDPFQVFPQKYCQQALEYERSQEFSKALFSWKVVRSFLPNDREALERIAALEKWMRKEAEEHFQKGLDSFHKQSIHEAQKEFLIALTYNPDHAAALDYLKHRLRETDYILYETQEGDTLRRIAREIYKDPEKDFLIEYFNDLESGVILKPGRKIILPVVTSDLMTKPDSPKEKPKKPDSLAKPEKIIKPSPEQAEAHYQRGVKYFFAEDLEKAIQEWEQTLQLNPDHPNARRDLESAKRLLGNLKQVR